MARDSLGSHPAPEASMASGADATRAPPHKHSVVSVTPSLLPGVLLAVLGLLAFVVAEGLASPGLRSLLLAAGAQSGIVAGLVVTTSLPGFRWQEPFQGGDKFVLLQAHGWMILGTAGCLSLVLMASIADVGRGVAGLGFSSAVGFGTGMIFASAAYFEPDSEKDVTRVPGDGRRSAAHAHNIWNWIYLPGSLLAATSFGLLASCESIRWAHPRFGPWLLLGGCATMVASACYNHFVTSLCVPGFRIFMPFEGGKEFVLLQAEGWMLLGVVVNFGIAAGTKRSLDSIPPGIIIFTGFLQMMANILLCISPSLFDAHEDLAAKLVQSALTQPVTFATELYEAAATATSSDARAARHAHLRSLSRRELQAEAKERGLRANARSVDIIRAILDFDDPGNPGNEKGADETSTAAAQRASTEEEGSGGLDDERFVSSLVWALAVVLAVMPPVVLWAFKYTGIRGVHDAVGLTPHRLLFCMFLSAPLSHLSGLLRHKDQGYQFFQPLLGGFRFIMSQGFGWFLYGCGIAALVIGSMNKFGVHDLEHMIPLLFFAQACISVSTLYFKGERPAHADAPVGDERLVVYSRPDVVSISEEMRAPMGKVFVCLCASVLVLLYVAWQHSDADFVAALDAMDPPGADEGSAKRHLARLGWFVFYGLLLATLAGFHLVWTHVWIIASGAIFLTGNKTLLAALAMLGLNICVTWYLTLWRKRSLGVPQRAMNGWAFWICEELIGGLPEWENNVSWRPINSLITGFVITDLGLHLLPAMLLLQLSAGHVTFLSVVLGYLASRAWSLVVTSHHVTIDWIALRERFELRLRRHTQAPSAYADAGIVNDIYGLVPPAPTSFFHHCVAAEALSAATCAVITLLPIEGHSKATIFRNIGLSFILSVDNLVQAVAYCVALGGATIGVGAALAYTLRPPKTGAEDPLETPRIRFERLRKLQ